MGEFELVIKKLRSCFGNHEEVVSAWHCAGCIVSEECGKCKAQKVGDVNEQQAN